MVLPEVDTENTLGGNTGTTVHHPTPAVPARAGGRSV